VRRTLRARARARQRIRDQELERASKITGNRETRVELQRPHTSPERLEQLRLESMRQFTLRRQRSAQTLQAQTVTPAHQHQATARTSFALPKATTDSVHQFVQQQVQPPRPVALSHPSGLVVSWSTDGPGAGSTGRVNGG
jgi:hypothetical protein